MNLNLILKARFLVSVPDPILVPSYYSVGMRFGTVQLGVLSVDTLRFVWYGIVSTGMANFD